MNSTKTEVLDPSEVSRRIVVGVGMVYELLDQVHAFLRLLREAIVSSDLDAAPLERGRFKLPLGHWKQRKPADYYLATQLGILFEIGAASESEPVDDDIEGEEEDEGDDDKPQKKGVAITPETQFLAIRVSLYEPRKAQAGPEGFVPTVYAAMIENLVRQPKKRRKPGGQAQKEFMVARAHLLRLIKQIDENTRAGETITFRIPKGDLQASVTVVTSRPLAQFDGEDKVQEFVEELVSLAGAG